MTKQQIIRNFLKGGLIVLISVLVVCGVAQAGTITPPSGSPSAQFYTLSDIYNRLNTNVASTEGGHTFTFSDALASSGKTLTEIYNAIPTIDPSKLLDDTTYMGVTGNIATRTLSSSSKSVSAGYYAATTLDAVDSDLTSNNIKSGVNIFGVDGNSNVVDTSSGNAAVGDILSGKVAWVGGSSVTGTLTNNGGFSLSCGVSDQAVTPGYYSGGTLSGDADLITGNIKSGVNIFGVTGKTAVVDTTEVSSPITSSTVLSGKKGYVNGSLITGTMSAGYSYPSVTLKTGQTVCYDTSGSPISCAGTGQDAQYTAGQARSYVDNNNGTISDLSTGLMWKKCVEDLSGSDCGDDSKSAKSRTQAAQIAICEADNTASYTDWRLPNINELASLVDYSTSSPAINQIYFPRTPNGWFWTSTSLAPSEASSGWVFDFIRGKTDVDPKSITHMARCVRNI